jgi:predicted enzyme related to lactoylglutathione lyase
MPATLNFFAINAEDLARARRFYETVFDWTFTAWGPPDFFLTDTSGRGPQGSLQGRRTLAGQTMPGVEVTFGVEDIHATVAAVEAGGGTILMPPFHLEGVGELIYFRDTEGNVVGACQYEREQRR